MERDRIMQRKFLSGLFLIILLNLLIKPFYILGIDGEVQNRVGEAVYGNYFALLNFSFLLNILLDLGIVNYNTRNIAQHPHLLANHFYRLFWLRALLFLLYAGMTLVSGFFAGYTGQEFYLLSILVINQFLVAIIQFSRSNLGGLHLFRTDAFVSVLDRALLILFCSVLLWTGFAGDQFRIEWFVYAQTLAYGLTALISVIILYSKTGRLRFNFSRSFSLTIIRQSFPYAMLILLMMLYNRMDAVMLERLLPAGDRHAGIYAQGYRYLDAVNMFALLFAGMLLPVFARQLRQNGPVGLYLGIAIRLLVTTSIIVALFGFFFREELLDLRYDAVSAEAVNSFGWLILSFIPVSLTYIYGTLLTANGSLRGLNYMAVTGLAVNLVLNWMLIPHYKAEGAAMATLFTQTATAVIQVIMAYRVLRLETEIKLIVGLLVFTLLLIVTGAVLKLPHMNFSIAVFAFPLVAIGFAFLFGLLRPGDLKEMINFRKEE